jgi:hypothetical protein
MAVKRRGRGEDSVYFDQANGYWVGSVSLGFSPDGKRRRRTVRARTKTEVRDKLRDLREEIAVGVRSPAAYTVRQAIDDWLRDGLDGRSAATVTKYRHVLKPVLRAHWPCAAAGADGARCTACADRARERPF